MLTETTNSKPAPSKNLSPAWDLSKVYLSDSSPEFLRDMELSRKDLEVCRQLAAELNQYLKSGFSGVDSDAKKIADFYLQAQKLSLRLEDMETYLHCELSVDSSLDSMRSNLSKIEVLRSQLKQVLSPIEIWIQKSDAAFFSKLAEIPEIGGYASVWKAERNRNVFLLSEREEVLLQALSTSGHMAWGHLYSELSGKLKSDGVGLAQAQAAVYSDKEETRKEGWTRVQKIWTEHQHTSAAVLNALAAWRLEVCRQRSHTKEAHFLDLPSHQNRMDRSTVEAMIQACAQNKSIAQEATRLLAGIAGKPSLDPWDLVASSPITGSKQPRSFEDALELIKRAFGSVDNQLTQFVDLMSKNQWLEGRVLPNKVTGAFCTEFKTTMEPRVFMTYDSSFSNITTLAHELGHAFHTWCLKDARRGEQSPPMSLAETASIFSETLLRDELMAQAKNREEKVEYIWSDLNAISAFLLNIPLRFSFERRFYELRKDSSLSANDLTHLMEKTWKDWYGDTYRSADPLFWASKLHFSIADLSFYNFPYTFGYLFALNIYARKDSLGKQFFPTYVAILRDTGKMSAEDLVAKHLGEDIRSTQFWQQAFDSIALKLKAYKEILSH